LNALLESSSNNPIPFKPYIKESAGEASVVSGRISNDRKELDSAPVLQVNADVSPGNSGSPVLNADGKVIGMITFRKDFGGDAFAIPISTIMDYVRKSGSSYNQLGLTDKAFREGLELYEKKDYVGAKEKFEGLQINFPDHSEVKQFIRKINKEIAESPQISTSTPIPSAIPQPQTGNEQNITLWFVSLFASSVAAIALLSFFTFKRKLTDPTPPPPPNSEPRVNNNTAVGSIWLDLINAQGDQERFNLDRSTHRLGREAAWADLRLGNSGWGIISNRHATFRRYGRDYIVYDGDIDSANNQGSKNRMMIDGQEISSTMFPDGYRLRHGDRLTIGRNPDNQVVITYNGSDSDRSSSTNESSAED
jgi:hypothetical protein